MNNLDSIIQQLRQERDRFDAAISALESMRNNTSARLEKSARGRGGRRFSAAAIARMRASQRARRARERVGQRTAGAKAASQSTARRQISAEGLAKIRAAQRKRWAKVRAGKKK